MKLIPLLRIYYERGNGRAVLDTGPGTERIEALNVKMTGTFHTGRAEGPPKFWIVAKRCFMKVVDDVAYVQTVEE